MEFFDKMQLAVHTHKYLGIVLQFPSLNNVSTNTNDQLKVRKHFYRHFTVVERWKISLYV